MITIQTWAEVAAIFIQIEILNMELAQEAVICVVLINKCLTMTIVDSHHPSIPLLTCKIGDIMRWTTTIVDMMVAECGNLLTSQGTQSNICLLGMALTRNNTIDTSEDQDQDHPLLCINTCNRISRESRTSSANVSTRE